MTHRFSETFIDNSREKALLSTDGQGRLLARDGSQLTNLPIQEVAITNKFDAFQVQKKSANFTAEEDVLYQIEASCTCTLPINPTFTGAKLGFLIVKPGVTLTLQVNASSSGSLGSRFCISGLQYGNSLANTNNAYASGGTTYGLTGVGKSLVFFGRKTGDGGFGYSAWAEISNGSWVSDRSGSSPALGSNATIFPTTFAENAGLAGVSTSHNGPGALAFVAAGATSNVPFTLVNGFGELLIPATATTATSINVPVDTNMTLGRGFRQQRHVVLGGRGGSTTTVRTATITLNWPGSTTTPDQWNSQNIFLKLDGRAETLGSVGTTYYGQDVATSYFLGASGRGVTRFKLGDGSLTSSTGVPLFDLYNDITGGVQRNTSLSGAEIVHCQTTNKLMLLYQYSK